MAAAISGYFKFHAEKQHTYSSLGAGTHVFKIKASHIATGFQTSQDSRYGAPLKEYSNISTLTQNRNGSCLINIQVKVSFDALEKFSEGIARIGRQTKTLDLTPSGQTRMMELYEGSKKEDNSTLFAQFIEEHTL